MNRHTPPHRAARAAARRGSCLTKLLVGLLILTLGFIVGGLTAAYMVSTKMLETLQQPERFPDIATTAMKRNYDLDEPQTEKVREIFHERYRRGVWLTWRMWPIIDTSLDDLAGDLRGVLNDEQAQQFNADYEKIRANFLKRPEKPESPPGGLWNWIDLPDAAGSRE